MTVYDFVGFLSGVAGLGMALLGLLLAALAGLWMLLVIRRPGRGRVARGIAAAGLALVACGVGLFFLAELSPFRRGVDRAVLPLTALALLLSVLAGWWAGRRRRPRPEPEAGPDLAAPAIEAPAAKPPGQPEGQ
jgi:hypothetical protein